MGRGSDCEIKISDISVSRTHARLIKANNKFYIEDLDSKFGTLCKLNAPHEFTEFELDIMHEI